MSDFFGQDIIENRTGKRRQETFRFFSVNVRQNLLRKSMVRLTKLRDIQKNIDIQKKFMRQDTFFQDADDKRGGPISCLLRYR